MTRLLISTNIREVAFDEPSGYLYVIDLDQLQVLRETAGIEPPYREFDLNPRGGTRGLRGLSFQNGELALANFSALFFFDRYWNLVRTITHPSISSIHEIVYVSNSIWVTSTANDLLARLDLNGKLCDLDYIRSHRSLMHQVRGPLKQVIGYKGIQEGKIEFRNRTYFASDNYDRTHLNGIEILPDGRLLISLGLIVGDLFAVLDELKSLMLRVGIWKLFLSFNRSVRQMLGLKKKMLSELVTQPLIARSAVITGYPNKGWQLNLQIRVAQNPSHSPRMLADGTGLYLATSHGSLVHFDRRGNIISDTKISDKFCRGLLVLPDGRLAIGADNRLLIYDVNSRQVIAELEVSRNTNSAIFDIKIMPDDFDLPPKSLQEKHGKIIGYEGSNIIWDRNP